MSKKPDDLTVKDDCPNNIDRKHAFSMTGKNIEKAVDIGFIPCMYCTRLFPIKTNIDDGGRVTIIYE